MGCAMTKVELFSLHSESICQKVLTILIGFVAFFVFTSCSLSETSSASYLPPELEKAVQRDAAQFFTTTGLESLRLDTVTELSIHDIRHPTSEPNAPFQSG